MAAVVAAPAPLSADDARALLQPPPVDYTQIYASLTPRDSLPLLAVSGVTGKAFWIGSLPQPPDEEEETDDEETGEESEEEHEHETDAAAIKDYNIAKIREERREESTAMYAMWKSDPARWLIKSKIVWSTRHESKRAPSRSAVPNIQKQIAAGSHLGKSGCRSSQNSKRAGVGGSKSAGIPGRSTVSLKALIQAGLLQVGPEALWISYLNQTWSGALDSEGAITFNDQVFYSPSAWAIHCKRLANPGKKADDGWKSVRSKNEQGPTLHDVKLKFLSGLGGDTSNGSGNPDEPATETPGSDRKRKTGLVSDATPRSARKRERVGEDQSGSVLKSPKITIDPTDMSWLNRFADPGDAEGALERDPSGELIPPGGDFASLVGKTVQVFWPSEETWHAGRVLHYDPASGAVSVLYATGDVEQGVGVEMLAKSERMFVLR